MRIYGTSPLYNYVELIFRCKRMFIVAIIVGSLVTAWMVQQRKDRYQAEMLVSLVGRADIASVIGRGATPESASLKANALNLWLKKLPDFMEQVGANIGLDRKYPPDVYKAQLDRIRDSTTLGLVNTSYLEIKLTWNKPDEAEEILREIYNSFRGRWVDYRTAGQTSLRQILEKQFNRAEKEANAIQVQRLKYTMRHWWTQSSFLASTVARVDSIQNSIMQTQADLADARERLVQIGYQLRSTPAEVQIDKSVSTKTEDPTLSLKAKLQDKQTELNQKLQTYSDAHPTIQALRREIAGIQTQIAQMGSKPTGPVSNDTVVHTTANPEYQKLVSLQNEYTQAIRAWGRRQEKLQSDLRLSQERLMQMPGEEINYSRIMREFTIKDSIRSAKQSALAQARLTEEADRDWERNSMGVAVQPKAEKLETSGKKRMLFLLGPLMGIFIAFCFSLLAEALDHTLRTPIEVEKYLGKPVLAVIPKMRAARQNRKQIAGSSKPSITS